MNETLGVKRAEDTRAAVLRATDSTFEALRAAWRNDASRGTRACVPGWAVMCGWAGMRRPKWRSRRLLGERLNRAVGWPLLRPAEVMRIGSEC